MINEIFYRPAGAVEDVSKEYIELHNPGLTPQNLENWKLDKGVAFTFPAGASIAAGGYVLVAADPAQQTGANVFGPWIGTLSNTAEEIRLVNQLGVTQDSVNYASEGDWAQRVRETTFNGWSWLSLADSAGHSLERRNATLPTDNGQNWGSSAAPGGTPNAVNSNVSADLAPIVRNLKHSPASPRSTDLITISCELVDEGPVAGLTATLFWRNASTAPAPSFGSTPMVSDGAGKFKATLLPMPNRAIVEFYVSATDGTNTRTWPAPTSLGQIANAVLQVDDEVFTDTEEVYRLVTTKAENDAYQALASSTPTSDREFNATLITLRHAQSSIRYLSGFRIRGASSRNYQFKPLRISVPADSPIDDVKVFNLNPKWPWNQYLGMKLLQAAGLRASDARAVEVRRNGVEYTAGGTSARDYGKWVRVDHLDADFADKHYPLDPNGNLYKKVRPDNSWAFRSGNVATYLTDGWTKETNASANDWSDLDTLMGTVRGIFAAHGGGAWDGTAATAAEVAQLSAVADLDQWIRWMAIENLMGNAETNASNGADDDYSFYRGLLSGTFEFVAHDHDTLFGLGEGARPATSNFFDMTTDADVLEPLLPIFGTASVPGNLVVRQKYYAALRELANTIFAEPAFSAFVDNHIGNWVPAAERTAIKNYVASRLATLDTAIANDASVTVPPYVPPVLTSTATLSATTPAIRLSEILARNVSAYPNGATYPDVIEIYNGGPVDADLGGMTLTDDSLLPAKYTIPTGTTLPAGGYLLVFADSDTAAPGLHAGFGLDQDGDEVRLYASGGALVDSVAFGPQAADRSISRTGAGQNVWALTSPTLGANNAAPAGLGALAGIRINELLSNPDFLTGDDFLEIYNPAAQPVALGGVIVTDDFINYPARHVLPPLSFIGGQDFAVFRPKGDSASADNPTELAFKFSTFGTWAAIIGSNGALIDRFDTDTLPPDVSKGLSPDGSLTTTAFGLPNSTPTPNAPNVAPPPSILALLNQLRVSEFLYKPNNLEYVELQNIGNTPLDLSGVRFTTGLTYTFPAGTTLAARAVIVVCKDRAAFQAQFGSAVPLAPGQFSGTLDNSGEIIGLQCPAPWDIFILRFRYEPTWYAETAADHSLEVDDIGLALPRDWDERETWIPSVNVYGTPGTALPPFITSPLAASAVVGDTFSYQITTKRLVESYSATGLPDGMTVNAGTGLISGVPTGPGQFQVIIGASNSSGSDSENLVLTITDSGPFAGFSWSGIAAAEIQDMPFTPSLRAIDSAGRTVKTFNSAAQIGAVEAAGLIVFTEIGTTTPTPDYFEIQNVGAAAVDTTGWFVVTSRSSANNNPANAVTTTTWSLPAGVAAGQIIGATDTTGTLAPTETPYGADIDWQNNGQSGWAMLVDGTGVVRDFVSWGYTAAQLATINFTSRGFPLTLGNQWSGNGTPVTPAGQSLFRVANTDTNQAADWALGQTPSPRGTQNAGLLLPWSSAFTPLAASGVGTINLVNGMWSGAITISTRSTAGQLQADVPGFPPALSTVFAILSSSANRPPSFSKGSNQTTVEDSGPRTVVGWATNISAGPPSESGQSVSFLVTSDNPSLFSTAPAIAPNGTLTYEPAPDAFGSAIVTVRARDSGGTADGGVDTSAPQQFTITVSQVNDAPTITLLGTNVTRSQVAGPQSIPWATGITAGPANESSQLVNISVSVNNGVLFSVKPAISTNGVLTFTINPAVSGSAVATVVVTDEGGTANGGKDSVQKTFTITVTPSNLPPTFNSGGNIAAPAGLRYEKPWATAISPGLSTEAQSVRFFVTNNNPSIFVSSPFISATGVLTFVAGSVPGVATLTVYCEDSGPNNPANGDDNTSDPITFTIQITKASIAAGKYRGLVSAPAASPATAAQSGLVEVSVAAKGSLSGKLKLGGKTYGIAGQLDDSGAVNFGRNRTELPLLRKGLPPLALTLKSDLSSTERQMTGEIKEGDNLVAEFTGERDAYHAKLAPVPATIFDLSTDKGNYTAAFVAGDAPNGTLEAAQFPQGDGWSVLKVNTAGSIKMRGQFADGTPFSYASALDSHNRFPLYAPLYKSLGSVHGMVAFQPGAQTTLESAGFNWFRPVQLTPRPASQYPQGWPAGIRLGLAGAARRVVSEPAVLPPGNARFEVAGASLGQPGFFTVITIGDKNRVTATPPNGVTLKSSGEWSGVFAHPTTGKKLSARGVILRHLGYGTGFFLDGTESGRAMLQPQP